MTDTATPETGPVDAPASIESIVAEMEAGTEGGSPDDVESIVNELVNEAESDDGEPSREEPAPEDDATEPAEDAAEPEEEQPEEQTYTVKVNGEEREVPLSELLNGYSRTEDYKAKTAAVAEERRQIEAQKASLETDLKAEYANQLEQATDLFAQFDPVLAEAQRIDWNALKAADPAGYLAAQDAVQARLTAIQRMKEQVGQTRTQAQQELAQREAAEQSERFDRAASKIVETLPDLADEAKFTAFATDAIGYLRNQGFSSEEIAGSLDERVLLLADKARRLDAHEAAQKSLPEKRVVPASKVKPLTTDGTGSRATSNRFPASADRDRKGSWIANQILSEL